MKDEKLILADVAKEMENNGHGVRSYSGRAMYGASCIGIEGESVLKVIVDIMILAAHDTETPEQLELFGEWVKENARWDNMGLDMIVYFPSVPAEYLED